MTTPIDTTRLRALLDAASDPPEWRAAVLGGCMRVLDADGGIVATVSEESDAALIAAMRNDLCALLDEVEGLRARLDEAYPRALQAAAGVVFRYDLSSAVLDMEDEDDVAAAMDALADDILELSAEQIEACDAKVERDHAAAVER